MVAVVFFRDVCCGRRNCGCLLRRRFSDAVDVGESVVLFAVRLGVRYGKRVRVRGCAVQPGS